MRDRTPHRFALVALLTGAFTLALAPSLIAQPGGNIGGVDITGSVSDRDNTRAYGTVYDPDGNPIGRVDIWVMNDRSPAERLRAKSRPTGTFQIRNVGRLYTRDDIYGLVLRLEFESPGFQKQQVKVPVEKNSLAEVFPILWPEGQDAELDGWCVMLRGTVTAANGKPARGASVEVTSPDDPALSASATADKKGVYEVLLWNVPPTLTVRAQAEGATAEENLSLGGDKRTDLVAMVVQDLEAGS